MRYLRFLFIVCITIIFSLIISQSWALDQFQEEEYQKAKELLKEGKIEDAKRIFTKVADENPTDFKVKLGIIDTTIEEARVLKANKNPDWKNKVYKAFGELKRIFPAHKTSPEIYLSFAKCYALNKRPQKAERSLKKAFYFKPDYTEAFIIRGDISFEEFKRVKDNSFYNEDYIRKYKSRLKKSYEKALSADNLNSKTRAMIHYKLGMYYDYVNAKTAAKEYWNKAVTVNSDSYWGKKAQEQLGVSN